jgi:predicted transcriptional regulator
MKKRNIKVVVGNRETMANEFIKTWHQLEAGDVPQVANEKIYFENEKAIFHLLTPKRCELLRYVHAAGEISILALAKQLERNYRNVYQDVKELSQIDLIMKNEKTGKYFVPWAAVITEISMIDSAMERKVARSHKAGAHAGLRGAV